MATLLQIEPMAFSRTHVIKRLSKSHHLTSKTQSFHTKVRATAEKERETFATRKKRRDHAKKRALPEP